MVSGYVVLGRAVGADVPAIGLVFWRTAAAAAILGLLFAPRIRRQWTLLRGCWRELLLLGVLQAVTGHVLLLTALKTNTAINTGVLMATQPVLTVAAAWIVAGEAVRPRQVAGLAIAAAGALVVAARGDLAALAGLSFTAGDLLVELAMISFAVYNAAITRLPRELDPFVLFFGIVAVTLVPMGPLYAAGTLWLEPPMRFDAASVASVLYFAVFASILGIVFLNTALTRMGPARAGVYLYLLPVFVALLAILILGETPRPYHFAGLAIVTAGVYLADRRPRS